MNTNRIGVIGIGKLGLSFALLAEHCGYAVMGCDTRKEYVQALNGKTYTTTEPLVEQYLQNSRVFVATTDIEDVVRYADTLFVFVPTPSKENGEYDHRYIDAVVNDIQELSIRLIDMSNKILVIGCTTMPGYTAHIAGRLKGTGISVVYNPEFIAQGDIINGLRTADMVLVGTSSAGAEHALRAIYRTIMAKELNMRVMSPTAAEITKISINCYLTMKIAYANMIGEIAINTGIEQEVCTILQAIGDDSRIGNKYLRYGFGYGGPCLPRDMRALGIHSDKVGIKDRLPHTVDILNGTHSWFLRDYYTSRNPDNLPFIFTQLSYKKGTEMLVESQQYRLCKELLVMGYKVVIHESEAVCDVVRKELELYSDQITFNQDVPGIKIAI